MIDEETKKRRNEETKKRRNEGMKLKMEKLRAWAKRLKREIYILYFAYRDKRVPWYTKAFTAFVVAYAFSPVDLIPDFIPVLGYLDDLIIVPIGIMLALKMIPKDVIADCKIKAEETMKKGKPRNWAVIAMGTMIVLLWSILFVWLLLKVYRYFS